MKDKRGQLIIAMLIFAMIVAIVVPALVILVRNEARETTKEIKQTRAFHLAEASADRGMYKLNESQNIWYSATHGILVPGYAGDVIYTDITGGYYKIKFSSGPGDFQVTILGYGKDEKTDESRIVKIVCYRELPFGGGKGALNILCGNASGTMNIHWGGIMTKTYMDLQGNVKLEHFPRKYARGYITPRYSSGPLPKYGALADEDLAEWHAGYPVPEFPDIDFAAYAAAAQQVTGADPGGTPAGSSYYIGNHTFNGKRDTIRRTYYVTGNCTLKNSSLSGDLIVMGKLIKNGTDKGPDVIAKVPKNAWMEYQEGTPKLPDHSNDPDSSDVDEYPGDLGYRNSGDGTATYNIGETCFCGFVYIGGTFDVQGNPQIYGIVLVPNINGLEGNGTWTLWYNYDILDTIKVTTMNPLLKLSWGELKGSF